MVKKKIGKKKKIGNGTVIILLVNKSFGNNRNILKKETNYIVHKRKR